MHKTKSRMHARNIRVRCGPRRPVTPSRNPSREVAGMRKGKGLMKRGAVRFAVQTTEEEAAKVKAIAQKYGISFSDVFKLALPSIFEKGKVEQIAA
jgi:hypothetical protein